MYFFEFEGLIQDAALGKPGAWDRLAGYLRKATEEVVCGMLNPPFETSKDAITTDVLRTAQGELQRLGHKIHNGTDIQYTLSRLFGFSKKPVLIAFERWFLHLAVKHCHVHYHPWLHDWALRQLYLFRGAVPPADIMEEAIRECLVRLGVAQRAVLVLYSVGSVLTAHKVTFRDVAATLGWGESDQAAKSAEKLSQRGKARIEQIWTYYEYEYPGGTTL